MEGSIQTFEPLVTEIHPASEARPPSDSSLPAGIVRLRDAGGEMRKALLLSALLAVISLVLFSVLSLGSGRESDVVWTEEFQSLQRVLVEGP